MQNVITMTVIMLIVVVLNVIRLADINLCIVIHRVVIMLSGVVRMC